jgi:hypothetical protein
MGICKKRYGVINQKRGVITFIFNANVTNEIETNLIDLDIYGVLIVMLIVTYLTKGITNKKL